MAVYFRTYTYLGTFVDMGLNLLLFVITLLYSIG